MPTGKSGRAVGMRPLLTSRSRVRHLTVALLHWWPQLWLFPIAQLASINGGRRMAVSSICRFQRLLKSPINRRGERWDVSDQNQQRNFGAKFAKFPPRDAGEFRTICTEPRVWQPGPVWMSMPEQINGVWGLRPQRVQGRALAFLFLSPRRNGKAGPAAGR